jgi:hypothetical protein
MLSRWSVIYVLDSTGRPCETHVLGKNGKLTKKSPQHRRKFNSSHGTSPPSYHQLTPDIPEYAANSTPSGSNISDDFVMEAIPDPQPSDPLELTASFDDNHGLDEDWFTVDWFSLQ